MSDDWAGSIILKTIDHKEIHEFFAPLALSNYFLPGIGLRSISFTDVGFGHRVFLQRISLMRAETTARLRKTDSTQKSVQGGGLGRRAALNHQMKNHFLGKKSASRDLFPRHKNALALCRYLIQLFKR
jgi:hypothetical protein